MTHDPISELVIWLREQARSYSDSLRRISEDKTRRNRLAEGVPEDEIDYSTGYTWPKPEETSYWKAADALTAAEQRAKDLEAENARLREALEPFAETPYATVEVPEDMIEEYGICQGVTVGDLRRARSALSTPTAREETHNER